MTFNPDELEEYDDDYQDAPDGNDFPIVAPGVYQAWVEKAYIDVNDYDHCHQLNLQLKIVKGEFANATLFVRQSFNPAVIIKTAKGSWAPIEFLKQTVARLGLDPQPTTAREVGLAVPQMLDRILEVKVVANEARPEYPKVYVQRFVAMLSDPPERTTADDDLDDVGF
jgi:hypothetical protein